VAHIAYDAVTKRLVLAGLDDGEPPCATTMNPVTVESVSVSQLNSFNRCPRRWFFQKIRRVKVPTEHKTGANTGTEIHAEHDHYYKRGFVIQGSKHEKKVRASLAHLPPCGSDVVSELPFSVPVEVKGQRLSFNGVIDLVDSAFLPALLKITDHKSTGNIAKLEAEPVDVYNDPQMLTYAHVGYTLFNPARVEVAHNTISSKHVARTIPPVYVYVSRQKAQENWVDQLQTIGTMIGLASSPPADWNDVTCNTAACSDFNGCDFLPICTLKNPTLGAAPMAHDESAASDLLARLNALNGATKPEPPPITTPTAADMHAALTATAEMILPGEQIHNPPPVVHFTSPSVMEAPAHLAETGEIQLQPSSRYDLGVSLLPPDAPSRMTPAAEEKPMKKSKAKKVEGAPGKFQHKVDKMITTVDELVAALDAYGEDGWEIVGFFDGVYAVFKRPAL
jgi:CRISPR/Cas system-associated exonuclease Cas4 (RecB family)